ncbi:MAG: hypothetical protein E7665_05675 [Ruminococcaceae bacterium]|nr:hypothetical protein [Oscillospiraceae bacterium]
MNNNDREFLVQKIRTQYTEKEYTALDELKALDKKVKRPANVFAYIFGSIGAVIMGSGMSLVMTDIADTIGLQNPMVYGIIIGIIGLIMAIINYPIYRSILGSRRKKYADQIIALSDKIVK